LRPRRRVIVINSATEQPTDKTADQARQDLVAAVHPDVDVEATMIRRRPLFPRLAGSR
jgi:hypothetical protein